MYNNLIEEDIMILDNEFFKIDTMFESVDKMYDIKQRELEYNYIYTESINEEYVDLYTEAEVAKDRKEQGLLGRLFTAILNFIRSIRAKILRLFGNDKKAKELEDKIKGNPKLANQTVEITNTSDSEKAIDEGTSFFGSLIDKIVKGTATEADADAAEEKNKSLLSRIAIFGGGALLAAGGAKVASDKLKERGVTKQTIKETVSNLFKREEDTKKKSNEVTQTNEQNVQKGDQALKNNSQSGNEENTKAGRRIMGFITGAGKFFTGKASELKSKINGVSSNNNDDNTGDNKGSSKSSNNRFDFLDADIEKNDVGTLRERIGNICYTSRDFSSGDFDAAIKYVESKGIKLGEPYNGNPELILNKKKLSECTEDDFRDAVFELKENFCTERINEVKKIGKYMFGPGGKAKKNDDKKKDSTKDEQQTSTSQARPKIVNYPEFSDATDNDKEKLIMDASKAIKTIPQNSERGKREKENLEKIISKGISINSGDYNALVSVVRNEDISKKYKQFNDKKNEQPKNKTDIQMDDEEASIKCKHIIREIKTYDSTNHVLTKDEMQKINEIDKNATNKKCTENDLNMVQKINDDMKKRTPDTSRNNSIFNHINTEEPNSYCNRIIKEIETEPGEGAKLTDDEKKQIDEIKDRLKNKKCTENDVKILDRIYDEQYKRMRSVLKNDKNNESKPENKVEKQPETQTDKPEETQSKNKTDTTEQKKGNKINNDIRIKSDITASLSGIIREIINCLLIPTKNIDKNDPPKNVNVYHSPRGRVSVYYLLDVEHTNPIRYNSDKETEVEYLKKLIEFADYFNKIRNNINFDELCKYTNEEDKDELIEYLNNLYSKMNRDLDDAKKNLKEIEEYERQQKSSKTTNESSYDLINDILTIFENSF